MKPRKGSLDWIRAVLAEPRPEARQRLVPLDATSRDEHRAKLVPLLDPSTLENDARDAEDAQPDTADQ
jgi:hypothetical protein